MKRRTVGVSVARTPTLRWRIVMVLLFAALLPLAIAGFGSWVVFRDLLERRALEQIRTVVQGHALAIEDYLSERVNLLQLLAESNSLDDMSNEVRLRDLLANLNEASGGGFIDLGVIDAEGNHLAYVGPYDLKDRNYRGADWFKEVSAEGTLISDVFLGFRQVPHCIVAVRNFAAGRMWILRATINSNQFDTMVKTEILGSDSDAYIVNRDGLYQTTPKTGRLLDKVAGPAVAHHEGVTDRRVVVGEGIRIEATTWINNDRWMLAVQRDLAAVQGPVNQAITRGAYVVLVAVLLLVATTFLATWHLTRQIDTANAQRDEMSRAFMRSAKLASIGELSAGLAHEINNPLATISAEQTNIIDLAREINGGDESGTIIDSANRSKAQVRRCARITKKMLQFGRERDSTLELTNVGPRMVEISDLMRRRAGVRNMNITLDIEADLPPVLIDPVELEQVLVNLMNNSFDAIGKKGGDVRIAAHHEKGRLHLTVTDDGKGIKSEELEHIFEPFYTSKPVGMGTGLGLSVCYGIVHSWGGRIAVESERGGGTTVHIYLPLPDQGRVD